MPLSGSAGVTLATSSHVDVSTSSGVRLTIVRTLGVTKDVGVQWSTSTTSADLYRERSSPDLQLLLDGFAEPGIDRDACVTTQLENDFGGNWSSFAVNIVTETQGGLIVRIVQFATITVLELGDLRPAVGVHCVWFIGEINWRKGLQNIHRGKLGDAQFTAQCFVRGTSEQKSTPGAHYIRVAYDVSLE
ncbi:hypothetical protein B0H16DRAFT_1455382 [Mycena metata]|uniref:Uncharacterized protein n=1 Tax=Mycena metata TaxID=1033252 RepID=A0AAD7JEV3_9AGAR|nr:hypothetical protein B0H16DRAFT_1455382 [Mycena metata]